MTPRVKQTASISIGEFFERHAGALSLTLLGEKHGFERPISEPAPNRPGLALAGFFSYFAKLTIDVKDAPLTHSCAPEGLLVGL